MVREDCPAGYATSSLSFYRIIRLIDAQVRRLSAAAVALVRCDERDKGTSPLR